MKVRNIIIENILGIEALEIKPGALTVISGRNAAGKTSVLSALRNIAEGGHDPTLLRHGAEEGSIELGLGDVTITKKITPSKSTTVVRHAKLGKISRPQEWIRNILDGLSLDPVQFLTAKPKERVEILLEALPLKLTNAELERAVPKPFLDATELDQHPLNVLDDLQKLLYNRRREYNVAAKEKRATMKQLEESLPSAAPGEPEGGWKDHLAGLFAERKELEKEIAQNLSEIQEDEKRAEREARAEYDETLEKLRQKLEKQLGKARSFAAENRTEVESRFSDKRDNLAQRIGEAQGNVESELRAAGARQTIERFNEEAANTEAEAFTLTQAMENLEKIKLRMLKKLPVQGLKLKDGEIYVGDVPFDRVNDAEKHRIAIEIGKLKAGELGLLLIDRGEIFDSESWKSFSQAALDSGLQIIAARVTDDDLSVTTE